MKITEPIQVNQKFEASIQTVWKAITDLKQMHQWYFANIPDFKPEVGFETRFLVQNEGRNFTHIWKVTEVVPPKLISYTWNFEEYSGEGLSTFELGEKYGQTLLTLKSFVIRSFPNGIPEFKRESGRVGWDYLIKESLKKFLEG